MNDINRSIMNSEPCNNTSVHSMYSVINCRGTFFVRPVISMVGLASVTTSNLINKSSYFRKMRAQCGSARRRYPKLYDCSGLQRVHKVLLNTKCVIF